MGQPKLWPSGTDYTQLMTDIPLSMASYILSSDIPSLAGHYSKTDPIHPIYFSAAESVTLFQN